MMICTKKTIEKCPYTSVIQGPPEEPHCNTFFKITFVEHGEADIDFYKKDKKWWQHLLVIPVVLLADLIILALAGALAIAAGLILNKNKKV